MTAPITKSIINWKTNATFELNEMVVSCYFGYFHAVGVRNACQTMIVGPYNPNCQLFDLRT